MARVLHAVADAITAKILDDSGFLIKEATVHVDHIDVTAVAKDGSQSTYKITAEKVGPQCEKGSECCQQEKAAADDANSGPYLNPTSA